MSADWINVSLVKSVARSDRATEKTTPSFDALNVTKNDVRDGADRGNDLQTIPTQSDCEMVTGSRYIQSANFCHKCDEPSRSIKSDKVSSNYTFSWFSDNILTKKSDLFLTTKGIETEFVSE